jgi:quercetin dioxygenase-like cupin family protein
MRAGWRSLAVVLLLSTVAVAPSPAVAQEPALAKAVDDPGLQWGPCPPGLPEGCTLTVLHGDPAKPNADLFLKLPAKSTIAEHTHTSAERMILVSGELRVSYKGQPEATLKAGSYAYGPAKLPHSANCVSATPCVLFIAFEQPVDLIPVK